jgi:hypothetical protein
VKSLVKLPPAAPELFANQETQLFAQRLCQDALMLAQWDSNAPFLLLATDALLLSADQSVLKSITWIVFLNKIL